MRASLPSLADDPHASAAKGFPWELPVVLALALIARLAFFNGPLGSDDIVYLNRSIEISEGIWSSANYNGALRYGFNIPAGAFLYLFGVNTFTANLWPFLCSLAEVAVVYLLAGTVWDRRTAAYAALILSFTPLHIAASTRILADSVVCFFLSLSFALFFIATRRGSRSLFFLTGLAMGGVFWTKELAVVTLLAFAAFPLVWKKLDKDWLYLIGGGLVMLILHLALMYVISGDPLHLFKTVLGQVSRSFIQAGDGEDGVWYYFRYLFLDIKHVWLAPFFAVAAIVLIVRKHKADTASTSGAAFIALWLVSLLAVMSFFPVSIAPLRFVMKQSNYLTLFLAPISLLAGYVVAALPRKAGYTALLAIVSGGLALGALEQADLRVFTSNSQAAVEFAKAHPESLVIGSSNNSSLSSFYAVLERRGKSPDRIKSFRDVALSDPVAGPKADAPATTYVILDRQTSDWFDGGIKFAAPLPCWREFTRLVPTGFGLSKQIIDGALVLINILPASVAGKLTVPLQRLVVPKPAVVYRLDGNDPWCGGKKASGQI